MEQLIKVSENKSGDQVTSARDLHEFLEVKKKFTEWFKDQSEWFTESVDYQAVPLKVPAKNGVGYTTRMDYVLTIDCAKEMAMMSKVPKGKQARQYFIACEKQLKEVATSKPVSTLDMVELMLQQARQQEARLSAVEDKVLQIEAQTATRPDYITIMGFAILQKVKVSLSMASQMGRKAKTICDQKGYHVDQIADPRFGKVNVYPTDVLRHVFSTTFV